MRILQTEGLKKYYGTGDTEVRALDGVDLTVERGEFVAIVGTSGSGKSTLLHMLGGLDRPTAGKVTVDGKDIFALKDEELTIFRRRKIGFVFQSYNLVPVLSVWENMILPIPAMRWEKIICPKSKSGEPGFLMSILKAVCWSTENVWMIRLQGWIRPTGLLSWARSTPAGMTGP